MHLAIGQRQQRGACCHAAVNFDFQCGYLAGHRCLYLVFNGRRYGPTERFPDEAEFRKQRARDWIKRGLCQDEGIALVVVHAEDLSLAGMQRKVGELLQLRDLRGHEALIRYLEEESARYRESAEARGQGRPPA